MPNKILRYIIIILISASNFSFTPAFAETPLNFKLISMHYGLLKGEPLTKGENKEITYFMLDSGSNKGSTKFQLTSNHNLHPSELVVYRGISGTYYVTQVQAISGNTVSLMTPLKEDVRAGVNLWNFYFDYSHPNAFGFYALGDYALQQLKTENLINKTHAFIGDSWFDNSYMVSHLTSKLNANKIINKAQGGRRAVDVLNAFDTDLPASASVQPDYVWIILGTNDFWDEISRQAYIDNLKKIIRKVNNLGAKALVFTSSVAPILFDSNNAPRSLYFDLSNHYADDLLALSQSPKGITANEQGNNLIIKYSANGPISNNSHLLFFIDTDNNANTGYQLSSQWNNVGADYLIQDDYVYKSLASDWNWGNIKPVGFSNHNKIIVSKNDLGFSNNASNLVLQIGVVIYSDDWSKVEDYYPKTGNMQKLIISKPSSQLRANNDTRVTPQGTSITIDVLANDAGTGISINDNAIAANGTVYIANNKLVYTPNSGYFGIENFWYEIVDSSGQTARGLVNITVEKNTAIKANTDTVTVTSGSTLAIDVLANDSGTGLTIGWYDDPNNGTASVVNNKLVYTSYSGFTGKDIFWYELVDSSGNTTWGKIDVSVQNNTTIFKANNDFATVKLSQTVLINALKNDTGKKLTLIDVDDAWTGIVTIKGQKIEYKSDGSFSGKIVIWYGISDLNGDTDWASITINIIK